MRERALVISVARDTIRNWECFGADRFFGHGVFGLARAGSTNVGLHPAASRSMISANAMAKQYGAATHGDKLSRNRDLNGRSSPSA
jgi:hypothetical protein